MEKTALYILNRREVERLIKLKGNKSKACEFIERLTGLPYSIYNNVGNKDREKNGGICNPKVKTVPFNIANGLQVHIAGTEQYDFSRWVLDVRRTMILFSSTGEMLFETNEKIALSIMLLFYDEMEWWTVDNIIEKSEASGSLVVKPYKIKKALKELCTNEFVIKNEDEQFSLNIDKLIGHISDSKFIDNSNPILT